jgi:hypothetical protein
MNAHKFSLVFVCACLLLDALIPQKYVSAEGLNFVEIPLEAFHDEKPIELQGLISSQTLNFSIPQSWLLGKANWLEIKVRTSPLLDSARS